MSSQNGEVIEKESDRLERLFESADRYDKKEIGMKLVDIRTEELKRDRALAELEKHKATDRDVFAVEQRNALAKHRATTWAFPVMVMFVAVFAAITICAITVGVSYVNGYWNYQTETISK